MLDLLLRYRDVVEALAKDELLPAIVFIFSRAGCDRAAAEVGVRSSKSISHGVMCDLPSANDVGWRKSFSSHARLCLNVDACLTDG